MQAPAGGMALWARADPAIDLERWSALALEHGVAFLPGRRYAFDGGQVHAMRLGFTPLDEARARRGRTADGGGAAGAAPGKPATGS